MPTLPPIVEIIRTLFGAEERFHCRLLAADDRHAVVLWIAPEAMYVHGVELPAGTISLGHFWKDRLYNVYHWLDQAGCTLGYYFNIADQTRISPEEISWRDLVVDVLITPGGRCDVLDRDELPPDLDPALSARVEATCQGILDEKSRVLQEIEAASRVVARFIFPGAA